MKVLITRTDVIEVEPVPGAPEPRSLAAQLVAFRASMVKSIFDDDSGQAHETSDGEWLYHYLDHINVQVSFALDYDTPPNDDEP